MRKLSLLALSIVVVVMGFAGNSYAQQETVTQLPSTTSVKIDYYLSYPGILPDNPLYKLKVLRDRVSAMLISDPSKRVEFYLLQADKGILATAMLIDKNKVNLANETALKAENNMTLLTYELGKFTQKPESSFVARLKLASLKHQEVLQSLADRLPENEQATLIAVINFSKTNLQTIEKFEKKKFYTRQ